MSVKIGVASYSGGERAKRNYFSLKEGDSVFRILPPLFDLAEKGKWSQFYRLEYGYKDSEGRVKPFQDVRVVNQKTKMVEVESAAHLKREAMKAQLAQMKAAGAPAEQLKKMAEIVRNYNLDSKHYLNVIDTSGKIGLLKIPYTAKKALDAEIETLKKSGIDPLSVDNGRFFVFNRSGDGLDTTYTVRVYTETVRTQEYGDVQKQIVHKLTDDVIQRLEKEAFKLDALFPLISPEEVERIVKEGPKAVDEILGYKNNNESKSEKPTEQKATPSLGVAQEDLSTPPVVSAVAEPVLAKAEPALSIAQPAVMPAVAQSSGGDTQSEEDFLRSIGAM